MENEMSPPSGVERTPSAIAAASISNEPESV